jgi:hypothetical protein
VVVRVAYATEHDYATWTGQPVAPDGTHRRLTRASAFIDSVLVGAVYPVDDDGLPTLAAHIDALRDAACAQVEFWSVSGDEDGTGTAGLWDSVSIGSVRLARFPLMFRGASGMAGPGMSAANQLAPQAANVLRNAGLFPIRPVIYG